MAWLSLSLAGDGKDIPEMPSNSVAKPPIAVPRAPPIAIDTGMRGRARPQEKLELTQPWNPGLAPESRAPEKSGEIPGQTERESEIRPAPNQSSSHVRVLASNCLLPSPGPNLQSRHARLQLPHRHFHFELSLFPVYGCSDWLACEIPSQKAFPHAPRLRYCATAHRLVLAAQGSLARGLEPSVACWRASHRPLPYRRPVTGPHPLVGVVALPPPSCRRLGREGGLMWCSTRRVSRDSRLSPTLAHDATNLGWGSPPM